MFGSERRVYIVNAIPDHKISFEDKMILKIKQKREQMIQSANQFGYTDEQTVRYSQELDKLINEYNDHKPASKSTEVRIVHKQMIMIFQKMFPIT